MSIYRSIAKLIILDEKVQGVADRIDTSLELCNQYEKRYGINTTDKYTRMVSDSDDSAVYHIPDRDRSGDMVSPEMATGNDGTGRGICTQKSRSTN